MAHTIDPNREEQTGDEEIVAERILRSLGEHGVEYLFANLGSDHPAFLEAIGRVRRAGEADEIPTIVICPHEFAAMSIAHGYASATGEPQAVLVHVDVGTQNLGAAIHNAHRGNAPIFIIAGLAPLTHSGFHGSRDSMVHYWQDVFDQTGIHREYCRWAHEYRLPADPAEYVVRGLERAMGTPPGPVYLSATREALATPIEEVAHSFDGKPRRIRGSPADEDTIDHLTNSVESAERPVVITSYLGQPPDNAGRISNLVRFAETAGAGVIEHSIIAHSFPRDHNHHLGYEPSVTFNSADLVIVADSDVPWTHVKGSPDDEATVIQIDKNPSKETYPQWPFEFDETVVADAAPTFGAIADRLDETTGATGREHWRKMAAERRRKISDRLEEAREDGKLTPDVIGATIAEFVDDNTVIVDDAVTSSGKLRDNIEVTRPGSYITDGASGLGWGVGAAIGVKLAQPENRVISIVGDGGYLFSQPTTCAWISADNNAPTITVIIDNEGWKAVEGSLKAAYPTGAAASMNVPESRFHAPLDLTAPAKAVDAFTRHATDESEFRDALNGAVEAVDTGLPAVIVVETGRS